MRHPVFGGPAVLVGVVMAMVTAGAVPAVAAPAPAPAQPSVAATKVCQSPVDRVAPPVRAGPTVATGLRVGWHEATAPRYDRVVIDLTKPLADYSVHYAPQLVGADGLGSIRGNAFLEVRLNANAHDGQGHSTMLVRNRVVNWGSLLQAELVGDYEGLLEFDMQRGAIELDHRLEFVPTAECSLRIAA